MGSIAIAGSGGSSGLTVNATPITGGSTGSVLFDNHGVLGEVKSPFFLPPATGNTTYYISTTGSDSNNGTSPGTAFATFAHCMDVMDHIDWGTPGFFPTVQVENGTYNETIFLVSLTSSFAILTGDTTTPSNVQINGEISFNTSPMSWTVRGLQLNTGNNVTAIGMTGPSGCTLTVDDIIFNNTAGITDIALKCFGLNEIILGSVNFAMTIAGSWSIFLYAQSNALVEGFGVVLTLSVGVSFSGFGDPAFFVDEYSIVDCNNGGLTFSGTATGQRYGITRFSNMNFFKIGAPGSVKRNQYPGSTVGSIDRTSTLTADIIYLVATPASGSTVTTTAGQHAVVLNPAGVLATLTVNLPTDMSDSETFTVSTSQTITALTMASTDGTTIVGAPTTLAASAGFQMIFDTAANTWYPYA